LHDRYVTLRTVSVENPDAAHLSHHGSPHERGVAQRDEGTGDLPLTGNWIGSGRPGSRALWSAASPPS